MVNLKLYQDLDLCVCVLSVWLRWMLLVTPSVSEMSTSCSGNFIGPNCDIECHCKDAVTGCSPCDECDRGYMGYMCSLIDVVINDRFGITDNDDTSCLSGRELERSYNFAFSIKFTYMEINRWNDDARITLVTTDDENVIPKGGWKVFVKNDKYIVHGEVDEWLKAIYFTFTTQAAVPLYCDMRISGGRNVAAKKMVELIPDQVPQTAPLAVDTMGTDTCAVSEKENAPMFTLTLPYPSDVHQYELSVTPMYKKAIQVITLTSYNNGTMEQKHDDTGDGNQKRTIMSTHSPITSVTIIRNMSAIGTSDTYRLDTDEGTGPSDSKGSLVLCDIQLIGNFRCPPGSYGFDCEMSCSGCKEGRCSIFGDCIENGCEPGFYESPRCEMECMVGMYGINCTHNCSSPCPKNCSKTDGTCFPCVDCKPPAPDDAETEDMGLVFVIVALALVLIPTLAFFAMKHTRQPPEYVQSDKKSEHENPEEKANEDQTPPLHQGEEKDKPAPDPVGNSEVPQPEAEQDRPNTEENGIEMEVEMNEPA